MTEVRTATTVGSTAREVNSFDTTDGARQPADLAPVALVDLLDRLLGAGVVVAGDVIISLAGVDLVEVHLHLLISSIRSGEQDQEGAP